MDRSHAPKAIDGWWWLLLAPLLPIALVAGALERLGWIKSFGSDFGPEEVANYLQAFVDGTGDDWAWDDFENMRIGNPALEATRRDACSAGPPNADKLKECLAKVEALAAQARVQALTHQPG